MLPGSFDAFYKLYSAPPTPPTHQVPEVPWATLGVYTKGNRSLRKQQGLGHKPGSQWFSQAWVPAMGWPFSLPCPSHLRERKPHGICPPHCSKVKCMVWDLGPGTRSSPHGPGPIADLGIVTVLHLNMKLSKPLQVFVCFASVSIKWDWL